MDGQDWGLLLLLSVLWGGAYFFAGVAVKELPPLTVVLARVSLAAVALLPLFWYFGYTLPKSFSEWLPFIGMGLLNNVLPFGLIFAGQTQITVGLSSIINAMTPLFTVIVMASFREERLSVNRVIGVLWGRKYLVGIPPVKSATCQLMCSTVIMMVVVSLLDQPWTLDAPSQSTVWSLVALAIFGTALAYIVFFKILVRAGPSNVMLVTLLIPITALILGNVFLGEAIRLKEIMGALIIATGLLFIDGRLISRLMGKNVSVN